jgi:hypothetical protein
MAAVAMFLWLGKVVPEMEKLQCNTPADAHSFVRQHSATAAEEAAAAAAKKAVFGEAASPNTAAASFVPPAGLLDLLGSCMLADPNQRKTAKELLALPWFEGERRYVLKEALYRLEEPSSGLQAILGTAGPQRAKPEWGPALEELVKEWHRL